MDGGRLDTLSRRALLAGAVASAATSAATGIAAPAGDARAAAGATAAGRAAPALPEFDAATRLEHWLRIVADLSGRPTWAYTAGTVYGFKPQADDLPLAEFARPLYGYRALIARQVLGRAKDDDGWRLRQRGWNFYVDAQTGEFVERLRNPYMGRLVDCPPRASPVAEIVHGPLGVRRDGAFPAETSDQGRPFELGYVVAGERVAVRREVFARFRTPDIDWYKLEADVTVHDVDRATLLDPSVPHVPGTFLHNLVAEWQTWMEMHGTPGHILFSGLGRTTQRVDAVPETLRAVLARRFPGTLEQARDWDAGRG